MWRKVIFHFFFIAGIIPIYFIVFFLGIGTVFADTDLEQFFCEIFMFVIPIMYLVCWIYFGIKIQKNN
ncbi:hypothetical protein BAZO_09781 [Schinkia azotoformans LMG 9581]|uniref:Uncharacterized protein n=1 Tax=Schinkia azotoformans LMG 9581 TaxID=1131731 RepID=K6E1Z9_SCHAZ|nr:hypothetical protein BAZO_09781 [Schinkia azotoformans LMG 9581]